MSCELQLLHYPSAISEKMQMCHKPTWWRQVPSSTVWKDAGRVTYVICCDWHSLVRLVWLTMLIMLDESLIMMIRDLRAAAWHVWRARMARAWHLMVSICVCRIDKWWSEHALMYTHGLSSCLLSCASFSFELVPVMKGIFTHAQLHTYTQSANWINNTYLLTSKLICYANQPW